MVLVLPRPPFASATTTAFGCKLVSTIGDSGARTASGVRSLVTVPDNDNASSGVSVSLFKNPIVHQLWTARQKAKKALRRGGRDGPTAEIQKSPTDSRVEVNYAFSSDPLLWDAYKNPWGQIRLGRLLEDLDALAGNIAFFHCHTDNQDESDYPVIVTASVDRIFLQPEQRPAKGTDQTLSGQVTWTGTSSMEIRMQCLSAGSEQAWLEAYVTFVTLDPHTKKPMKIPAIVPTTDEERKAFEAGAARALAKKMRRKQHKNTAANTTDIEQQAAQLLERAGPLLTMPSLADPHSILLSHTAMQNAMIAQPQAQNLHHRVFGGFLMRRAFELAFSNAYLFGGKRPVFLEVDEVSFASPVDVGDLLVFHSRVLYTEPGNSNYSTKSTSQSTTANAIATTLLHIEVEAWVTVPEHVSARMSNQFYFTFAVHNEKAVRTVLPANLDEARRIATRMAVDQEQARENERT